MNDDDSDVVVVEAEEELFTFPPVEHPLLDVDYQHMPETAGLDYAGELTDEPEAAPKKEKSSKS
jgi:hypothetical protein